jgi:hypothetical protein
MLDKLDAARCHMVLILRLDLDQNYQNLIELSIYIDKLL